MDGFRTHLKTALVFAVFLTPFATAAGYFLSGGSIGPLASAAALGRAIAASATLGFAISWLRAAGKLGSEDGLRQQAESGAIYASLSVVYWLIAGYTPPFATSGGKVLVYIVGCCFVSVLFTLIAGRSRSRPHDPG